MYVYVYMYICVYIYIMCYTISTHICLYHIMLRIRCGGGARAAGVRKADYVTVCDYDIIVCCTVIVTIILFYSIIIIIITIIIIASTCIILSRGRARGGARAARVRRCNDNG